MVKQKKTKLFLLVLTFLAGDIFFLSLQVSARPRYAKQTGLACKACHINPHGGGTLTRTGLTFRDNGYVLNHPPSASSHASLYAFAAGGLGLLLLFVLIATFLKRRRPFHKGTPSSDQPRRR